MSCSSPTNIYWDSYSMWVFLFLTRLCLACYGPSCHTHVSDVTSATSDIHLTCSSMIPSEVHRCHVSDIMSATSGAVTCHMWSSAMTRRWPLVPPLARCDHRQWQCSYGTHPTCSSMIPPELHQSDVTSTVSCIIAFQMWISVTMECF